MFVFYDASHGKQAKLAFSKDLIHCNVLIHEQRSAWLMLMFERTGLHMRILRAADEKSLIDNLPKLKSVSAIISLEIVQRKRFAWSPWWARSCNEVSRYGAGVDIGFTYNPRHLYSKLLKYNGRRNYEIISHWRRADEFSIRGRDREGGETGSTSGS